jgi:hypothetical protein
VGRPKQIRYQHLDLLADQHLAVVAEQPFRLAISEQDHARLINPQQGDRRSLQQALERCRAWIHHGNLIADAQ